MNSDQIKQNWNSRGYSFGVFRNPSGQVWANDIIFQFSVYWFCVPWGIKKYIKEDSMIGRGRFFSGDGRIRSEAAKQYGSGGLFWHRTGKCCPPYGMHLMTHFQMPRQCLKVAVQMACFSGCTRQMSFAE